MPWGEVLAMMTIDTVSRRFIKPGVLHVITTLSDDERTLVAHDVYCRRCDWYEGAVTTAEEAELVGQAHACFEWTDDRSAPCGWCVTWGPALDLSEDDFHPEGEELPFDADGQVVRKVYRDFHTEGCAAARKAASQ